MKTPLMKKIEQTIAPTATSLGYELVRVLMIGTGKPTLQIMAEKPDGTMEIEDCENLSRAVSAVLDVEDVMPGAFTLEVSSPGIDRPLTRIKDFKNYQGYEARIEIDPGIDGRRKFKGKLTGVEDDDVIKIETPEGEVFDLRFPHIRSAKLMLTDDLLKSATQKQQQL